MIDYTHEGGVPDTYTLFVSRSTPHTYWLRSHRMGYTYRVTWYLESGWGVYVRPEGSITGMHFFWDEIEREQG